MYSLVYYIERQLTVANCGFYSWKMTLKDGFNASFDNMYRWKGIREKQKEMNVKKTYIQTTVIPSGLPRVIALLIPNIDASGYIKG
jgi:hypothetical protein